MKQLRLTGLILAVLLYLSCNQAAQEEQHTGHDSSALYTCPMPQDSVFSNKPGTCPKCGMDLVKMEPGTHQHEESLYTCPMPQDSVFTNKPGTCPKCGMDLVPVQQPQSQHTAVVYTCPMHESIIRDAPGTCPICGMDLVQQEPAPMARPDIDLAMLVQPTNAFVVSSIPVTSIQQRQEPVEIEALGTIAYDTRQVGSIASRVSGRIEHLYVRYRYQRIEKGQRIMDIYSPELVTAQQNLLFLLQSDPENTMLIRAAKDKLLLLGMSAAQLDAVIAARQPAYTIPVYSNYSGHLHETAGAGGMKSPPGIMRDIALITEELPLKEGMYVQKGQSVFSVFDPAKAWVVLNIYGGHQSLVSIGNIVRITPETAPEKDFNATIDFIEPFYRKDSKTLTARVYFNNSTLQVPVGSQVRAVIYGNTKNAMWLPKESVLSLGMHKVVFLSTDGGFKAHAITTGITQDYHIQVLSGLSEQDAVAVNAQYLMDSETFIRIKD